MKQQTLAYSALIFSSASFLAPVLAVYDPDINGPITAPGATSNQTAERLVINLRAKPFKLANKPEIAVADDEEGEDEEEQEENDEESSSDDSFVLIENGDDDDGEEDWVSLEKQEWETFNEENEFSDDEDDWSDEEEESEGEEQDDFGIVKLFDELDGEQAEFPSSITFDEAVVEEAGPEAGKEPEESVKEESVTSMESTEVKALDIEADLKGKEPIKVTQGISDEQDIPMEVEFPMEVEPTVQESVEEAPAEMPSEVEPVNVPESAEVSEIPMEVAPVESTEAAPVEAAESTQVSEIPSEVVSVESTETEAAPVKPDEIPAIVNDENAKVEEVKAEDEKAKDEDEKAKVEDEFDVSAEIHMNTTIVFIELTEMFFETATDEVIKSLSNESIAQIKLELLENEKAMRRLLPLLTAQQISALTAAQFAQLKREFFATASIITNDFIAALTATHGAVMSFDQLNAIGNRAKLIPEACFNAIETNVLVKLSPASYSNYKSFSKQQVAIIKCRLAGTCQRIVDNLEHTGKQLESTANRKIEEITITYNNSQAKPVIDNTTRQIARDADRAKENINRAAKQAGEKVGNFFRKVF